MQMLSIDAIKLDERCQPRASIDPEVIDEYADAMTQGAEFPPLTVYRDGGTFFLADGFHRIAAARQAGQAHVVCEVIPGTVRDAILHAVGANATHGMRRKNQDKRRAVETLLKDDEWSHWSNVEIAQRCAVSDMTVHRIRQSLQQSGSDDAERTYTDRYGNTRTMNTSNIGKWRAPEIDPVAENVDMETGELLDDISPPTGKNSMTSERKRAAASGRHMQNAATSLQRAQDELRRAKVAYPDAAADEVFDYVNATLTIAAKALGGMMVAARVWKDET